MKITIFAATGGIGRRAVEQAVAAGHVVTAVVRNPKKLSGRLRIVTTDLGAPDPAALESAVEGADAVLSGLGPRSFSEVGIASEGTRAIVQAMKAAGVRRLVVVSASPHLDRPVAWPSQAAEARPGRGVLHAELPRSVDQSHPPQALCRPRADGGRHSGQRPGLDHRPTTWLNNKPLTGTYRTAYGRNLPGGLLISRADVAHYMLRVLEQPQAIRQAIGIAY